MNPTKVAVIGCGQIATSQHLPAYREAAEAGVCCLVGVCDLDPERVAQAGKQFAVGRRLKQLRGKPLKDYLKQVEHPGTDLVIVLQDVEDPVNVGAAFRIADACDARELALTGTTPVPPHPSIAGIGRGTHRRVNWSYSDSAPGAIQGFKVRGYTSWAIEVASNSAPYYEVEYPEKVCLVLGNEYYGVAKRTISVCDMAIYIPMYGKVMSLNVHVALGIAAYHIIHSKRIRER